MQLRKACMSNHDFRKGICVKKLGERFWKSLSNCVRRCDLRSASKTRIRSSNLPRFFIYRTAVARLYTESLNALSHISSCENLVVSLLCANCNNILARGLLENPKDEGVLLRKIHHIKNDAVD